MILFWGSLWGIAEATLGYLIHMAAIPIPGLPGLIMFPVAFYFMINAYKSTSRTSTIFYVALIAASIKLTDVLIPSRMLVYVLNPAVAIVLEGLAVSLVVHAASSAQFQLRYAHTLMMGLAWRGMFLVDQYILSLFNLPAGLVTNGMMVSLKFLVWESIINSLLIYAYLRMEKPRAAFDIRPAYAYSVFALAIIVQRFI